MRSECFFVCNNRHTPVRTANNCQITKSARSHTKVCKFDDTIFGGQDVRSFYIAVDNALIMQIDKTL